MSKPDFKTSITNWTTSDLQAFVQNLLSVDRSSLPASMDFTDVSASGTITAGGVTLTGAPRFIWAKGTREASHISLSDTTDHQVIATGTWTEVNYAGGSSSKLAYDSAAIIPRSNAVWTSNSAWQAPTTGLYAISGNCIFDGNATGSRQVLLNNTGQGANAPFYPYAQSKFAADGTNPVFMSVACVQQLSEGDTVAMYVFQNSGGNLNLLIEHDLATNATFRHAVLTITYLSPSSL